MTGGPVIAKAMIPSMIAPAAIDQASSVNSGKRRISGRACRHWRSRRRACREGDPNPGSDLVRACGVNAKLMDEQEGDARDRDERAPAKRGVGRWPRKTQASRLLGIIRSANTVATTPEVMCRSAR